jgi:hypothetical protein
MINLDYFITKKVIPVDIKLKYLITIPCVNRAERNAINVIDRTFESFKKSNMFESDINFTILLFESGSKDTTYLDFINEYNSNNNIHIIKSDIPLDGNSNTLRMFFYLNKLSSEMYDYVIWMDDDVFVCNKFLENADAWIKKYANFSLFSSLYVPYDSFPIKGKNNVQLANLPGFYGTCCTIFKPKLSGFAIPLWYSHHFEKFNYNPDTRFRDGIKKHFPHAKQICVSYPSLVQHMNIGSAIKQKKKVNQGHKTKTFIGEDIDPKFYEILI